MNTSVPELPIRTLDPAGETAIAQFYKPSFSIGLYLAIYLPVMLGLCAGSIAGSITYGLIAGVVVSACWLILRRRNIRRQINLARYIYQYGREGELVLTGIRENYGYRMNGMPQRIISLLCNGSPVEVKTFNSRMISVYTLPWQIVYTHPRYGNFMVPAGLFQLPPATARRSKALRWILLLFILPAFIFGLIFLSNSVMGDHSYSHAQPDALIYRQGGKWVLASVVTHFQAYEVSNEGVFGNDSYYAEAIDLQTGHRLWRIDLDAPDRNGKDFGGARLLGQSARYLFFLRNDLYVIDKLTGKVAARNNDFPAIKDKMPKDYVSNYESDAGLRYNDTLQAVMVKGNDGLFYTIDGLTLKTGTIDIPSAGEYFVNKFKFGNNYSDQITSLFNDGRRCFALLDKKDTALLAGDVDGFRQRSASESIRRMLYSCPSDDPGAGWRLLSDSVFLLGGFLVDATLPLHTPVDSLSRFETYQLLAQRYNYTNAPMRTVNGSFLVMHKTSTEYNATLIITGISAAGSLLWQVGTGYATIPLMYHDLENDRLYIAGNKKGTNSDEIDQMTCIDLKTGATHRYSLTP